MENLNTFRGRLLLILVFLLITTLSIQYYLNFLTQNENNALREAQSRTIVAAIALGFTSITSQDYRLQDLIDQPEQTFLDEASKQRILDILIIDNDWQITDSLDPDYLPTVNDSNVIVYKNLRDLTELPPLMEGARLGADLKFFPNRKVANSTKKNTDAEAVAIPLETSKGRWYVMILLKRDGNAAAWQAAQPLVYTLIVLLISTFVTFVLVWRFARPISNLSAAAREMAHGNLKVRVPDDNRNDEMGRLARNFNEMAAELEQTRYLEAQLQQAEKSAVVGRLGSAIAHEIRNPLNYINLTLDHLRSKFSPTDVEKREAFDKLTAQLKAEVARINRQISDFLNYSRPKTVDCEPMEAMKVIADSLRIIEGQAEERNISVVVEMENSPKVLGDAEFLRSVFNNLFINAVQEMEATGGQLSIRIAPVENEKFVTFEISDTGNGISADNISKIFEPYFSTKETGTGLGLAIVQKIVEMHNGTISVESNAGEGTTFTVRLPSAIS